MGGEVVAVIARAFCPRKGAHSQKNARSRFLPGDFSARAVTTTSSTNDVVEYPLPQSPAKPIRHAIPPCEAPLCDEVPFYGPVEHP